MSYIKIVSARTKFTPWEMHHMYTGIGLTLLGFFGMFYLWVPVWLSAVVLGFGLWFTADDAMQHIIQRGQISRLGFYTKVTFFHWFPYKLIGKFKD